MVSESLNCPLTR